MAVDTVMTFSAWVKWTKTSTNYLVIAIHDNGPHYTGVPHPGDGQWHRISVTTTAVANANLGLAISDGANTVHSEILFDGAQLEYGLLTDYCDGDQPGCVWDGAPHASQSRRLMPSENAVIVSSGEYRLRGSRHIEMVNGAPTVIVRADAPWRSETSQVAQLATYGGQAPTYGPGLTTVTNPGDTRAYPVLVLDGPATGLVYSVANLTTGETVPIMQVRSSTRMEIDFRGTRALSLAPGANQIALHTQAASCDAVLWWYPERWAHGVE